MLLLALVANVVGLELWLSGREVVYKYQVRLDAGTLFPVGRVSQWNMSGKLVVHGAGNVATVQVSITQSVSIKHILMLLYELFVGFPSGC